MGVPVFLGGFRAGEASRPEDLMTLARQYGIRRFIAYVVTSEGERVLKPENFDELISKAEKIIIIRKEIAGASPSSASSADVLAELETRKEELLRELEIVIRRINLIKIINQLEQLEQMEAQETLDREKRQETENTATEQQETGEEYIWSVEDNEEDDE